MKLNKKFILIFLFLIIKIFGQNETPKLYDLNKINDSTMIIGMYPHYDKNQTFKELNFIIKNKKDIKKVIEDFKLGEEIQNGFDNPNFDVIVVQNYKRAENWIVSPFSQKVLTKGHTYKFDIEKIKKLHKKFPLNYRTEKVIFKTKDELQDFLTIQKQNPKFLFSYNPSFKYEGSFEIQFPKNEKFSSPKAISQYVRPLIEKFIPTNEFSISYKANEYNIKNQEQFTMTITGSKKIFETLKVDELQNKNWNNSEESGTFFYEE